MDREQVRRDAEVASYPIIVHSCEGSDRVIGRLARHVLALLAELEQAERELRECRASFAEVESAAVQAKRDRDLIGAAFAEPCAECGHIDWRTDGYVESVLAPLEARLAAVPALVEELEAEWKRLLDAADHSDGTGEHVGFAMRYRNVASGIAFALERLRPLAAYEQAQG